MKWIKVKHISELPRDGREFIALWKGRVSWAQYCPEEQRFFVIWDPAYTSGISPLSQDREHKLTHYMNIPDMPNDYYNEMD